MRASQGTQKIEKSGADEGIRTLVAFENGSQGRFRPIGGIAQRYLPEILFCLVAASALVAMHRIPITHDVVWQFWVARQLTHGAVLYQDIWEINPPLWFWSAVPIHYLATWLHVPPLRLLVIAVVGAGALSALLTGYLAQIKSPTARFATMLLSFWLAVVMPIYDFGQREQLALIGALPYVALIARRSTDEAIPTSLALLAGLMAAYGFALKHYFVAIPILLEIWLFLRNPGQWRAVRSETMVVAAVALAYGWAVIVFAPDFFNRAIPMVRTAYQGYESPWSVMLFRPWVLIWTFIAAFFFVFGGAFGKKANPLVSTLLISAFGFAFAYFLQRKGWLYHSVPVTGAATLALGMRLGMADLRRVIPISAGSMIIALPLLIPSVTGAYFNLLRAKIDPILSTFPKGSRIFIATADPMWGWPTIEDHGFIWSSRLSAYWMIPAIAHGELIGPNPAPLRALGAQMQQEAALEIQCSSPALILFERIGNYYYQPRAFDVRAFFLRRSDIRSYLESNYREMRPTRALYVYRRVTSPDPLGGRPGCPIFTGLPA